MAFFFLPNKVRLGKNLGLRLRAYAISKGQYVGSVNDREAAELDAYSGQLVRVIKTFESNGAVYAYNVRVGGKDYHLPSLFVHDEPEEDD